MSILKVTEVKAGTELDGFDVSYRVTVSAPDSEHDNADVYVSRFPDKAVMKAVVLTAAEPFEGWTVSVDPAVATAAGIRNLDLRVRAEKYDAIAGIITMPFDAAATVEVIKTVQG